MGAGRLLVGALAAVAFAGFIAHPRGEAAAPTPRDGARAKPVDSAKSDELFALPAAAASGVALAYTIDHDAKGPGRQDVLTFGRPGGEHGYVRLEIRQAMTPTPDAGLFVALVRRAADAGLAVTRAGQSFTLPTRLGALEASEVALAADAHEWPCLGMRLRSTDSRLTIVALSCGDGGKRPTPAATACMLDALDLAPGNDDAPLRSFFEEAARRHGSACRAPTPNPAAETGVSLNELPAAPTSDASPVHRRGRPRSKTLL